MHILCISTQEGVAIGVAGLSFRELVTLGYINDAHLIIYIVAISVIITEITGLYLVKKGIIRSGEGSLPI